MSEAVSKFPVSVWDGLSSSLKSTRDDKTDYQISDQHSAEIRSIESYLKTYVDLLRLVGNPDTILGVNHTGTGLEYKSLIAGSNITITHSAGGITIASSGGGGGGSSDANDLTGTTLAATVVNSSLTGLGTIATGVWQATKIGLAYGGTNVDLTGTGGTSQVLRQSTVGGNITVSQLANTDISGLGTASTHAATDFQAAGTYVNTVNTRSGAVTLTSNDVGLGSVENTALSTWSGSSNITTLGTIATGVWHGTAVVPQYGGTGSNLSATGGAHQVLQQTTVGGNITVGQLANTDITGLGTLSTQNGTFSGTSSGTNTGDQTSVTGNAGSATVLQTARSIYGESFNGSSDLAGIISSAFGGTGNGFTKFSGPTTAEKTFTLPDASATILTSNSAVTIGQGGTGQATANAGFNALSPLTTKGDLIGFTTVNARLGVGTNGYVLNADSSAGTGLAWFNLFGTANIFTAIQTVNLNTTSPPTPVTGAALQIVAADTVIARVECDAFGANAAFTCRRANGTNASKTAIASGDTLGAFNIHGYYVTGGPSYSNSQASMTGLATQNWTSTNQGTKLVFATTPNNSTTLTTALTLDQDQSATFAGPANFAAGTITANVKSVNITQTWNAIGTTFDAPLFMNITNTTSAAGSLLADFQVGGVSIASLGVNSSFVIASTQSTVTRGILSYQYSSDTTGAASAWYKARGTAASPAIVQSGDALGFFGFRGYAGSAFATVSSAYIQATATEAYTGSNNLGASLVFATSANGSGVNTIALTLGQDQSATFVGNVSLTGKLTATNSNITTTQTDGLVRQNTTLSTVSVQNQYTPCEHDIAHAWNTTSVAADNFVEFLTQVRTTAGATPTGSKVWSSRVSAAGSGSFTDVMTLTSAGVLTMGTGTKLGANGVITTGAGITIQSQAGQTGALLNGSGDGWLWGGGSNAANFTPIGDSLYNIGSATKRPLNLYLGGEILHYNAVATAGLGIPAIYGLDNRTGLTSADGASITLYTATAANQIYRVSADIFATAFTSGTATYTIAWTENSSSQSMAVTSTVLNTLGTASNMIRPDNGTAITAQLTGTFVGTFSLVGSVERIA